MIFEQNHLYHVYNQGNNREVVFFSKSNFELFISKMREFILPFADVLAWCLMPNHFHMMLIINKTVIEIPDKDRKEGTMKNRSLNDAIAIILRSYTQAINKEYDRSGSLFRQKTKAVCLDPENGVMPAWYTRNGVTVINDKHPEDQYPQICFNYIHLNPKNGGIVKNLSDWNYSSFAEFTFKRTYMLINRRRVAELGLNFHADGSFL